jgi:flagellum-specific peptidoglycan hydrolase FlgJ
MTTQLAIHFFRQYGLKVLLFSILLFVVFKKDISFGIHFRTPNPMLKEQNEANPVQQVKKKEQPYLSEDIATSKKESSLMERFSNFPILGSRSEKNPLKEIDVAEIDAFLNRFVKIAQAEGQKYGIPVSIIMANALLQSQAGKHNLAQQGHNYFALPCTNNWKGETFWFQKECYRQYDKPWTSFRDHSLFLTTGSNQQFLALGNDYRAWAKAIERTQYYKVPKLANQLIDIIENLNLQHLDIQY